MERKRATLRDIATEFDVSVNTVWRVLHRLNKEEWTGTAKRAEEIRALAKKLGFRPNAAARAMQRGRFNRIALIIIRNVGNDPMGWSVLQSYLDYAVSALAGHGYALVIEPFDQERDAQFTLHEPPRLFSEILVDGALALDCFGLVRPEVDTLLKGMRMPVVWLNRNPTPGVCGVYCDESAGTRQLMNHLLELGHTRIGYCVGNGPRHYSTLERLATVRASLKNAGLDDRFVREIPSSTPVLEAIDDLLRRSPRPTALIAYNHIFYDAIMETAAKLGLRVPGDLSVAYFASQWELNSDVDPTAIKLPEGEMAKLGVELLLKRVTRQDAAAVGTQHMLPGTLKIGSTTGPAPAG